MRVAIVGAGTMGAQLALRCAAYGCETTLIARDAARGRTALDDASRESGMQGEGVRIAVGLDAVADTELVAETIQEDLEQKRALYRQLEAVIGEHVPIASGTSSFPPDVLGEGLANPGRVIVAHMVHPVTLVPLTELIAPTQADATALQTVERWLGEISMRVLRLRLAATGFLINRLQFALLREAAALVTSGVADARDVDAAVELALGPRWAATGPLASADLGGLRTFAAVARSVVPDLDAGEAIAALDADADLRYWGDGARESARARRRRIYAAIEAAR
ncbi:MAG TPA: 3-hydroxyacyl-CoA dehydrogenase family protein [Candidatus Sulfotelmatobacter sp.]|nr:3-hydroxyacyl-CoA dehydrogenase family protein [Candidatus Sulfotelmatobacter sp.]